MTVVQDRADDRDTKLVEPIVELLRVVVLVLRKGNLRRACLGQPGAAALPAVEVSVPADGEEGRVQDDGVEAQPSEPGRRAVDGVV